MSSAETTVSLAADSVLAEASARTGLEDFGAEDFREPMQLLLQSLDQEANLHAVGRGLVRERIIGLLINRLRTEDYFHRHPEIEEEEIRAPVFIAALPRTGTTMLHRFIASDPHMYAVLWYECRQPAPLPGSEKAAKDPRIVQAEEEVRMMLKTYPGLDAIHPMDPVGPDEDIMLKEHAFCSGMPESMADVPTYNDWELHADHTPAYQYLKRVLRFLQWQKKQSGQQGERWVLKAPEHLGHVTTILKIFPDATILQSHRDPLQTIPSISSMIYSAWCAYTDNPDKHRVGAVWCERFRNFLHRCMEARKTLPAEHFLDLRYKETLHDPFHAVQQVYEHIGMAFTEDAKQKMAEWREANRREAREAHHYTLGEYGFSEEEIKHSFSAYRQQYLLD